MGCVILSAAQQRSHRITYEDLRLLTVYLSLSGGDDDQTVAGTEIGLDPTDEEFLVCQLQARAELLHPVCGVDHDVAEAFRPDFPPIGYWPVPDSWIA